MASEATRRHEETLPLPFSSSRVFALDLGALLWQALWPLFGLLVTLTLVCAAALALGLLLGIGPLLLLSALVVYPAALALLAATAGLARNRRGHAWAHVATSLRRHGLAAAGMGLFVNAFVYSYLTTTQLVRSPVAELWLRVVWGGQSVFLVVLAAMLVYAWPLMALYDQPLRTAVRNGLLLAVSAPAATLAMLGGLGLAGLAFYWLGAGAATFAPLLLAVLLVGNCLLQVNLHTAKL